LTKSSSSLQHLQVKSIASNGHDDPSTSNGKVHVGAESIASLFLQGSRVAKTLAKAVVKKHQETPA